MVLSKGDMIQLSDLPQSVQSRGVIRSESELSRPIFDKGVTLEEAEKQLIIRTLQECCVTGRRPQRKSASAAGRCRKLHR